MRQLSKLSVTTTHVAVAPHQLDIAWWPAVAVGKLHTQMSPARHGWARGVQPLMPGWHFQKRVRCCLSTSVERVCLLQQLVPVCLTSISTLSVRPQSRTYIQHCCASSSNKIKGITQQPWTLPTPAHHLSRAIGTLLMAGARLGAGQGPTCPSVTRTHWWPPSCSNSKRAQVQEQPTVSTDAQHVCSALHLAAA